MKRILAITFAVSSLLKPGLVLCVEVGGDVRVEHPTAICCEPATESAPLTVSDAERDCDGCLDFSLVTHSLKSKRTPVADVSTPCMYLPALPADVTSTFASPGCFDSSPTTPFFSISTTVIRR